MNKKIIFAVLICAVILFIVFSIQVKKTPETKGESINAKLCDSIETYDLKVTCQAIFSNNPSMCKSIGNFDSYCYEAVFEIMENFSQSLCSSFSDYFPRATCYFKLARIEKDSSLCEKAGGRYQECSWEVAKLTKNYNLCEKIEVDFERYECLGEVKNDVSYCEKIESDSERSRCFIKLGKNVDTRKCGEVAPIENPSYSYAQQCISDVALATKDVSLCNQIENKENKWGCITRFSKSIEVCEKGESQFWIDFCKLEFIKNVLIQKT